MKEDNKKCLTALIDRLYELLAEAPDCNTAEQITNSIGLWENDLDEETTTDN